MAYKILGQAAPAATTDTTLYTVPVAMSAVCSTLAISNRGASATFRVAVIPAADTLANRHYIVFDNFVNQYDSVFLTVGITLAAGDRIVVQSNSASMSFSLFGSEM